MLTPCERHDGVVRPWERWLSDDERSVLLSELLLRHPELAAEAEEITSTLLVVENEQELADEIMARLRALRPSGPVVRRCGAGTGPRRAPVVAVAGRRVPRVGVVRGELNPVAERRPPSAQHSIGVHRPRTLSLVLQRNEEELDAVHKGTIDAYRRWAGHA